jgi:hypothetical protein
MDFLEKSLRRCGYRVVPEARWQELVTQRNPLAERLERENAEMKQKLGIPCF